MCQLVQYEMLPETIFILYTFGTRHKSHIYLAMSGSVFVISFLYFFLFSFVFCGYLIAIKHRFFVTTQRIIYGEGLGKDSIIIIIQQFHYHKLSDVLFIYLKTPLQLNIILINV